MSIKDLFDADHTERSIIECLVDFFSKGLGRPRPRTRRTQMV